MSKFVRISWDEAATIIADEIRRVNKEYGPLAICAHGDGHGETKTVHGVHGVMMDLLALTGGFTQVVRNADSWEGWYWGTKHVWGNGENGLCLPADNIMNDVTQHTDMLIHIGSDLETTPWGFSGQFPTNVLYLLDRSSARSRSSSPPTSTTRAPSTPTSGSPSSPTPTPRCTLPSPTPGWSKGRTTRSTWRPT